jgi:hypothetical protein
MVAVALNKLGHVTFILANYIFIFLGLLIDGKLVICVGFRYSPHL